MTPNFQLEQELDGLSGNHIYLLYMGAYKLLTRRQFIKVIGSSLFTIGYSEFFRQVTTSGGIADRNVLVLVYHRVGATRGHLTIQAQRLADDLDYLLDQGYESINPDQMRQFLLDRDVEMPQKPVLITFDDGYRDNYENALPILRRRSMTATFFVIAGMIGDQNRLDRQMISEMSTAGMSIGSHGLRHKALAEMSPSEIQFELSESKRILQDIVDQEICFLAYPEGSFSHTVIDIAAQEGYFGAFTITGGFNKKDSNPFLLKRVPVFSYDGGMAGVIAKRT